MRRSKKIKVQLLKDEVKYWFKKAEKYKKKVKELGKQLEQLQEHTMQQKECHPIPYIELNDDEDEEVNVKEKEEEKKGKFTLIEHYMEDSTALLNMTWHDQMFFDALVEECTPTFIETTWRGSERVRKRKEQFDPKIRIFLTLF